MSMVDSLLFASLLDALKPETYLILIGDVGQSRRSAPGTCWRI